MNIKNWLSTHGAVVAWIYVIGFVGYGALCTLYFADHRPLGGWICALLSVFFLFLFCAHTVLADTKRETKGGFDSAN